MYDLKKNVLTDEIKENFDTIFEKDIQPYNELMAYYKCAMMEVERKFRVWNEVL